MLRDEALMAQVTANVDAWPEPTEEERQTIAALLHRPTAHPRLAGAVNRLPRKGAPDVNGHQTLTELGCPTVH
jgi:hypothetical protein